MFTTKKIIARTKELTHADFQFHRRMIDCHGDVSSARTTVDT
jgi:hypothetical protein